MKIYTGISIGKKFDRLKELNLGIMISAVHNVTLIKKEFAEVPCALDNGAFSDYQKQNDFPFDEYRFLKTLSKCIEFNIKLDFIVCPDIIAGGIKSLEFSLKWSERLTSNNLALALQDGISVNDLTQDVTKRFSCLFLGGSPKWKWNNLDQFKDFAKSNNKKIHVGRVGNNRALKYCNDKSIDSVDSTNFARNNSWQHITEYVNPIQNQLL